MRLKSSTYLPKVARLVGGKTLIWMYKLMLNYQALKSVLLPTSLDNYCFKAERGPWRSATMFQGPLGHPWRMTGQSHQQGIALSSGLLDCGDGESKQVNREKEEPRTFIPKLILGQLHPYLWVQSLSWPSCLKGVITCVWTALGSALSLDSLYPCS